MRILLIPKVLIFLLTILSVCAFFYIYEKIMIKMINNKYSFILTKKHFYPHIPISKIANGYGPIFIDKQSQDAIIVSHGAFATPNYMKKLIDEFSDKSINIYVTLLAYHASVDDVTNINIEDLINRFLCDIEYISKQYRRVVLIAHSFAGSIAFNIAINKKIPDNVSIIFYATPIELNMYTITNILLNLFSFFLNYIPDIVSLYPDIIPMPIKVVQIIQELANYNKILISNNGLGQLARHTFVFITNDPEVNYEKSTHLLKECTIESLDSDKHSAHLYHESKCNQLLKEISMNYLK